ncbi:MAG: chromosomal replication initiator protein DnaA [Coprobacillus sp.]|nr:chromosomal replication initiator protein DnaA [Coprobacillus sp.]
MPTNDNSVSEMKRLWERILERIRLKLQEDVVFDNFFSDAYLESINNNEMLVVANSRTAIQLMETSYKSLIAEAIKEISQTEFKVKYITEEDLKNQRSQKGETKKGTYFEKAVINPDLTFDNFVVGPFNREASQAAVLVATKPGKMYNPLFIYSGSGLGKTHLLNAIGNYISKNTYGTQRVLYIAANDFVDEYLRYLKADPESESLKDFFNSVDVLLFDDVQFLVDKTKTEEMFFYIYSAMIAAGKQVVITSDKQPNELKGLDERLVTRFSQGLVVSIKDPERETCIQILRQKIEANGLSIDMFDENVLIFIADHFSSNVRELEGALNRLIFYAVNFQKTDRITLDVAAEALQSLTGGKSINSIINEQKIIDTVADYYHLTPSQLTGTNRTGQVALARHVAMYLIRQLLQDVSLKKIGDMFGGKDHTTVINGVQRVDSELKTNIQLKEAIDELTKRIKG